MWIADEKMWLKWDQHEQATDYAQTTLDEQTTCKTTVVTMVHNRSSPQHGLHLIIDVNRNNRYNKLLRLLAYVLRFVKNCRSPKTERYQGSLTVRELHTAEMKVIQNCQATAFHEEIHNIIYSSSARLTLVKQTFPRRRGICPMWMDEYIMHHWMTRRNFRSCCQDDIL